MNKHLCAFVAFVGVESICSDIEVERIPLLTSYDEGEEVSVRVVDSDENVVFLCC